jgi:hypothetical protein
MAITSMVLKNRGRRKEVVSSRVAEDNRAAGVSKEVAASRPAEDNGVVAEDNRQGVDGMARIIKIFLRQAVVTDAGKTLIDCDNC